MKPPLIKDSAHLWHSAVLEGVALYRATIVRHSFKRHSHDTYVIGLVDQGVQQFRCERDHYVTPPRGLIVINPGDVHTGEAVLPEGFHYRALYPTASEIQAVAAEVSEVEPLRMPPGLPWFRSRVTTDPTLFAAWYALHRDLECVSPGQLDVQSRYRLLLATLIRRDAAIHGAGLRSVGSAPVPIRRVQEYLQVHYAEDVSLNQLAALVNWTPYYLIRAFRAETGLPPHAWLEGVRVRQAQALIRQGHPLIDVAGLTGFSSQSHLTTTFRRVLGVTPGAYARAVYP